MSKNREQTMQLLLLLVFITLLFFISIRMRSDWFGELSLGGHQWLTGSTIKFVNNWLEESPFSLFFLMLENPNSVEFTQLNERGIYLSYPFGAILPIYFTSLINNRAITPALVMSVNLINQYLISIILSSTIFYMLKKIRLQNTFALMVAAFPGIAYIFLPGNLYYHQNVYFSDQAVLFPFVAFVCIEIIIKHIDLNPKLKQVLLIMQYIIAFYGALCDHLFFFVGIVVFIKRLSFKEFGRTINEAIKRMSLFALPFITALAVWLLQIYYANGLINLISKFLFRTGASPEGAEYIQDIYVKFWLTHVRFLYGRLGAIIILFSIGTLILIALIYFLKRKELSKEQSKALMFIEFSALLIVPCLLQIYFFKNHSAIHNFSVIKLSPYLSTVPFIMIPLIFCILGFHKRISITKLSLLFTTSFIIAVALIANTFYLTYALPLHKIIFPPPYDYAKELFINNNTLYRDIVFSTEFEIKHNPPQQLAYSKKRVYQINSIKQIIDKVIDIEDDYIINIFVDTNWVLENSESYQNIIPLIELAQNIMSDNSFMLYKIPKEEFVKLVATMP